MAKEKTPGSGRKAGTPNRKTEELMEICDRMGINPFEALLKWALSPESHIAIPALKEVCQYVYPKRKALEVSGEMDMNLINRIKEIEALPDPDIKKLAGK